MKTIASSGLAVSSIKTARFISLLQMYLFGAGIVLIAAFLFAAQVLAQEEDPANTPISGIDTALDTTAIAESIVTPESLPPTLLETPADARPPASSLAGEVGRARPPETKELADNTDNTADETVTDEDLEIKDAAILPDSPLYGIKRFGRGLRKALTFNKGKKIGLEIRYANQELADAQQLVEEKGDSAENYAKVAEAVGRVEESFVKVNEVAAKVTDDAQAGEVVQAI